MWAGTRKVKPIWILLKQETVSGNGISWAICKSAHRSRQTTTPAPHHSGCPSCRPTNSVKALKAKINKWMNKWVSEYVPAAQKSFRTDVVESVRVVLSRSATRPPITITSHISENNAQHTSPFYTPYMCCKNDVKTFFKFSILVTFLTFFIFQTFFI